MISSLNDDKVMRESGYNAGRGGMDGYGSKVRENVCKS